MSTFLDYTIIIHPSSSQLCFRLLLHLLFHQLIFCSVHGHPSSHTNDPPIAAALFAIKLTHSFSACVTTCVTIPLLLLLVRLLSGLSLLPDCYICGCGVWGQLHFAFDRCLNLNTITFSVWPATHHPFTASSMESVTNMFLRLMPLSTSLAWCRRHCHPLPPCYHCHIGYWAWWKGVAVK